MFGLFSKKEESPFVTEIRYFPKKYDPGKSDFDAFDRDVEKLLLEIKLKLAKFTFLKFITNELIFLQIKDRPDLKFTIVFNNKQIRIDRQWNHDYSSKVLFSATVPELKHFSKCLDKGYFEESEAHWFFHLIAKDVMEAFYNSPIVTGIKYPGILKLHRLVHLELINPYNFKNPFTGKDIETKITVINAIGQFMLFYGHHGVAPILLHLNLDQALELVTLVRYEIPKARSKIEYLKYLQKFLQLRAATFVKNPEYYNPNG